MSGRFFHIFVGYAAACKGIEKITKNTALNFNMGTIKMEWAKRGNRSQDEILPKGVDE